MRTSRSSVALFISALGAVVIGAPPLAAQQTDQGAPPPASSISSAPRYPATLDYGTGLIDIPVAWVSPSDGDIWLQTSGRDIPACSGTCDMSFADRWNTNLSIDTHWRKRFSLGLSVYSQNPEWGFFGQALLLRERQGSAMPALAVGFRNLGPYNHEDRLLLGHDIQIGASGGATGFTPGYARKFSSSPSVYGVLTKSVVAGGGVGSFSLGYGSGIFGDDGGLGKSYNDKGTIVKGLFLGGRYAFRPSPNSSINLLAENNGWDWNAGVVGEWRGISLGLYGTELEEGGKSPSKGSLYTVYNYTKFSVSIGYNGNLHDIAHGAVLRARVGELEQEQIRLRAEIAQREHRIQTLEASLQKAQSGELAEVAKRREQLDAQVQEERDAIRRAEERLQQLQGSQSPSTTPPSGGTVPPR